MRMSAVFGESGVSRIDLAIVALVSRFVSRPARPWVDAHCYTLRCVTVHALRLHVMVLWSGHLPSLCVRAVASPLHALCCVCTLVRYFSETTETPRSDMRRLLLGARRPASQLGARRLYSSSATPPVGEPPSPSSTVAEIPSYAGKEFPAPFGQCADAAGTVADGQQIVGVNGRLIAGFSKQSADAKISQSIGTCTLALVGHGSKEPKTGATRGRACEGTSRRAGARQGAVQSRCEQHRVSEPR